MVTHWSFHSVTAGWAVSLATSPSPWILGTGCLKKHRVLCVCPVSGHTIILFFFFLTFGNLSSFSLGQISSVTQGLKCLLSQTVRCSYWLLLLKDALIFTLPTSTFSACQDWVLCRNSLHYLSCLLKDEVVSDMCPLLHFQLTDFLEKSRWAQFCIASVPASVSVPDVWSVLGKDHPFFHSSWNG